MSDLEHELRELPVAWPETPDVAAAVVARLAGAPAPRRRRRPQWPAWQIGVAIAAALVAVVMAVPPARSAVLEWLGFASVRIERGEPRPSQFGSELSLGEAVTLEQARRQAGFPLAIPAAAGRPDGVYLSRNPARVDFVYRRGADVGLLVTQFRAVATPLIEKTVGEGTRVERLQVRGDPAFFLSGAAHGFAYMTDDSSYGGFEEQRLAGDTLLVDRRDGVLLRIEGELSREEAVRIAESAG
jgi:hypothetical protein